MTVGKRYFSVKSDKIFNVILRFVFVWILVWVSFTGKMNWEPQNSGIITQELFPIVL